MTKLRQLALVWLLLTGPSCAQVSSGAHAGALQGSQLSQFMVLDPSKSYLVSQVTGKPVYLQGEQAFELALNLSSNSDIDLYLSTRQSQGFNFIWMGATDIAYLVNSPNNALGNPPFDGAFGTNFDPAYWSHMDYVIQRAGVFGFTVLFNVAFVGSGSWGCTESTGWCPDLLAASDSTLTAWGVWLGNRYQNYPNIIWMLGGDLDLTDYPALEGKLGDIYTGIKSVDKNHLITVENQGPIAPNSQDLWQSSGFTWDLDFLYTGLSGMYAQASAAWTRSDHLPTFVGEDKLEGESDSGTALQQRTEKYATLLGGSTLGLVFGNCVVWTFGYNYEYSGGGCSSWTSSTQWKAWFSTPVATAAIEIGKLMRSREFWKMAPDLTNVVMTAGYGSGDTMAMDARSSDGQTIIAYIPTGNASTVTINMAKITSSTNTIHGWWFNPSSAATTDLGTFANSGTHNFTPPDSNDWVLVLDDNAAGLPAPGSASL